MNQSEQRDCLLNKRSITGVELATFILLKSLRTWRLAVERGLEDGPTKKLNLVLVRHFTGVVKAWETWRLELNPPTAVKSTLAPSGVSLRERVEYQQKNKTNKQQGG